MVGMGGRNIPAHAGKTNSSSPPTAAAKEHPRARGENAEGKGPAGLYGGTSPRTRGKRPFEGEQVGFSRNIPAHAGKTRQRRKPGQYRQEHPRARGENHQRVSLGQPTTGTSPRTRGKRRRYALNRAQVAEHPRARGKTRSRQAPPCQSAEHPRARGENPAWWGNPTPKIGTSPRTRGKRVHCAPLSRW